MIDRGVAGPRRLTPRGLQRPPVDPADAAVFGRPRHTDGAFLAPARRGPDPLLGSVAPPDPVLAQAFGRPAEATDTLQRAPQQPQPQPPAGTDDPWRDPRTGAVLGAPALAEQSVDSPAPAPRLGVREVLFGSRVAPRALLTLGVLALVVGLLGGLVVRAADRAGGALTDPKVTLAQVSDPAVAPSPGAVTAVAATVLPAVVSVESRSGDGGGTGSGVVIDAGGYIVTNNHVISQAATNPQGVALSVVFSDGTRAKAQIVGRDTKTDLAVLRAQVANPTVAQLGTSADLSVGDQVIAVGSPLGLAGTVTSGIVSAVRRPVRLGGDGTDTNAVIDAVQTDAAINPGNSGGPLVDFRGRVVAINTAIRTSGAASGGSIGLGFAIPVDEVTQVAQELIRTGQVKHPDLGVNSRSVSDGTTVGAQVANVQAGGAAAAAGLVEGDVITRVGQRSVSSADELAVAVMAQRIGETVPVSLVRAGRSVQIPVTLQSD
jgi:S1-C subfamily serine protease